MKYYIVVADYIVYGKPSTCLVRLAGNTIEKAQETLEYTIAHNEQGAVLCIMHKNNGRSVHGCPNLTLTVFYNIQRFRIFIHRYFRQYFCWF